MELSNWQQTKKLHNVYNITQYIFWEKMTALIVKTLEVKDVSSYENHSQQSCHVKLFVGEKKAS